MEIGERIQGFAVPGLGDFKELDSSIHLDLELNHLFTTLNIELIMEGAVYCMTMRQPYHATMQNFPTFVYACNDGILLVTVYPLTKAQTSIFVLCIIISVHYACGPPTHSVSPELAFILIPFTS